MVWDVKQNAKHAGQRHLMHSYPFHHTSIWWWYLMHMSTFDDIWCICPRLMISDAYVNIWWYLMHMSISWNWWFRHGFYSILLEHLKVQYAQSSLIHLPSLTLPELLVCCHLEPSVRTTVFSRPDFELDGIHDLLLPSSPIGPWRSAAEGTVAANHWFIGKMLVPFKGWLSRVDCPKAVQNHFPYDVWIFFEEDRSVCWSMLNQTSQSNFLSSTSNNTFWSHCAWQNSQPFEDSQPRSMSFGPIHS